MATALDGGLKLAIKKSEMLFTEGSSYEDLAIRPAHPRWNDSAQHKFQSERTSPQGAPPGAVERRKLADSLVEAAARGDSMTSE